MAPFSPHAILLLSSDEEPDEKISEKVWNVKLKGEF
jgi:hypothetical protein